MRQFNSFLKMLMLPLTEKMVKLHQDSMVCSICRKKFPRKLAKEKIYCKVRDHSHFAGKYRGAAHGICNLRLNVANEIPVVFRNESKCDSHFIIKGLTNEFKGQFECLGDDTEKYKPFSFPIEQQKS